MGSRRISACPPHQRAPRARPLVGGSRTARSGPRCPPIAATKLSLTSCFTMTRQFHPTALAAFLAALLSLGVPAAQAKQQCSAEMPSSTHGQWWSYRLIDGRKCWYEGRPGLSKSLLEWPKATFKQPGSGSEVTGAVSEKPGNPLDSQAEGSDTLSRFGDWTINKNDAVITLYSDTRNLAVRWSYRRILVTEGVRRQRLELAI